jgi:hypothetical protein
MWVMWIIKDLKNCPLFSYIIHSKIIKCHWGVLEEMIQRSFYTIHWKTNSYLLTQLLCELCTKNNENKNTNLIWQFLCEMLGEKKKLGTRKILIDNTCSVKYREHVYKGQFLLFVARISRFWTAKIAQAPTCTSTNAFPFKSMKPIRKNLLEYWQVFFRKVQFCWFI